MNQKANEDKNVSLKKTWSLHNKHLRITATKNKNGSITKIPNNEAHLITGDINIKHPMIGVNDLITNRTVKITEQWPEGEIFIILSNYEPTHKDGGTLEVHLDNSKLTNLFEKT